MTEAADHKVNEEAIHIESAGVSAAFMFATPLGLLIEFAALGGLALHDSVVAVFVALAALAFGTAVLVSCAYSVWGTCSLVFENGAWTVTHTLWRWRWTWRFTKHQIRAVFLYDPPPSFLMWPGQYGQHVRVSLARVERSIPIGSGMLAPRETLERIQAMLSVALPPTDLSSRRPTPPTPPPDR